MKVIAGLGNPGMRYYATRHNCGFLTIDMIADRLGVSIDSKDGDALIARPFYKGERLLLIKPQSYMNLSGFPIQRLVDYYKVDWQDLLVIYDDMDLAAGMLRLKRGGSAGGHNGMKSIIQQSGTDKIQRLKIGIGHSVFPDAVDHVIGRFHDDEMPMMAEAFKRAADAALCWVEFGIGEAMNRFEQGQSHIARKTLGLLPIAAFLMLFVLFLWGINNINDTTIAKQKENMEGVKIFRSVFFVISQDVIDLFR